MIPGKLNLLEVRSQQSILTSTGKRSRRSVRQGFEQPSNIT
ncbi:MAG: hypothetical protein AAGF98_14015 [Cyanobacteria bacterium P01_H01_bin.153]